MKILKKIKLPRAHAWGIFSLRFVGSKIPPKRKLLHIHPRTHVRGFLRRGINSFVFENAEYQVGDDGGNKLLIKVDYKKGGYDLIVLKKGNADIRKLTDEAGEIAMDLIKRKSRVNFARARR